MIQRVIFCFICLKYLSVITALCDTPLMGVDDWITTEVSGLSSLGISGSADVGVFASMRHQFIGIVGTAWGLHWRVFVFKQLAQGWNYRLFIFWWRACCWRRRVYKPLLTATSLDGYPIYSICKLNYLEELKAIPSVSCVPATGLRTTTNVLCSIAIGASSSGAVHALRRHPLHKRIEFKLLGCPVLPMLERKPERR